MSPLEDPLSRMAHICMRVYPGSEKKVVLALLKETIEATGQGSSSELGPWNLGEILHGSGVTPEEVKEAAHVISSTRKCAIIFGGGLSRPPGGREAERALVRLAVGLGSLEVRGGGLYPLDGGPRLRARVTWGHCRSSSLARGHVQIHRPGENWASYGERSPLKLRA